MLYAPTVLINWGEKMQFQMWILVFARSSQRIRNQPVNLRIFNLVLKSIISRIFLHYINGFLKSTVLSKLRDNALKIIIVKTSTLSFAQTKKNRRNDDEVNICSFRNWFRNSQPESGRRRKHRSIHWSSYISAANTFSPLFCPCHPPSPLGPKFKCGDHSLL